MEFHQLQNEIKAAINYAQVIIDSGRDIEFADDDELQEYAGRCIEAVQEVRDLLVDLQEDYEDSMIDCTELIFGAVEVANDMEDTLEAKGFFMHEQELSEGHTVH